MLMHYHLGKANVEEDYLSILNMGSVTYFKEETKDLVKYVHRNARFGVLLMSTSDSGVTF